MKCVSQLISVCFVFVLFCTASAHEPRRGWTRPQQWLHQGPLQHKQDQKDNDLEHFIQTQSHVAIAGILANIGPDGKRCHGAAPGIVIASPSNVDPDYVYTWTRDAALTMKLIVDRFIAGSKDLQASIEDYIGAQTKLQVVDNPSGTFSSGGLGEPKFNVDGSVFNGAWGRPQRDGPALRAITLIAYSKWLLEHEGEHEVTARLWPIIAKDLQYVEATWHQDGFDLWEEVKGSSFFTLSVQHRALVEGATLARAIGKPNAAYLDNASGLLCALQAFWNGDFVEANINANSGRSGKDANTILASIHTFDVLTGCDDATFQPCSSKALANLKEVVDSFRTIYPINAHTPTDQAVAIGRYQEDVYMGGHPWYLNTAAVAEQLYDALHQWNRTGSINVTETSLPFFQDFIPKLSTGQYKSTSKTYRTLTRAIRSQADSYLRIIQKYTPTDGSLAEQFSRDDGRPLSATHLTWSYAAFLTAVSARNNHHPAPWGASNVTLPHDCKSSAPCAFVALSFCAHVQTAWGDAVYIVGSSAELGAWDLTRAMPLSAEDHTVVMPLWAGEINLKRPRRIAYKYFLRKYDGTVVWEKHENREIDLAGGCTGAQERAVVVDDVLEWE
ncbi:hypothetical protein MRB53_038655 [Persea americana]|nr:hypothetical protein MRB53_038655 [Persea americana]